MSRIGTNPIQIPQGVTVNGISGKVVVKGQKGQLTLLIPESFEIEVTGNSVLVKTEETHKLKNIHGLFRSLLSNAVTGVTKGWDKDLELVGVGYKVAGGGNEITLSVGFTHPVKILAPNGISFVISDNTKIKVAGIDKKAVGDIAAIIRSTRPPEPYKGKGIRYAGEVVRKKAGKAVKATSTSSA